MMHLISLGAGVQSSTLALMAAKREVTPMPDAAIFADTQAEPQSVYRWLDWLEKQLPFPVHRVTTGDLQAVALKMKRARDGRMYAKTPIPLFTRAHDDSLGRIPHRTCTADYKIVPIIREARKLAGIKRGQKTIGVTQWIGISWDEVQRMKPARDAWIENRWPLIELRMTRQDCLNWMQKHGYPRPPRSSCVFCPFHNNAEWRRLQVEEPAEFARAVQFERDVQKAKDNSDNMRAVPFLHRTCKPLDTIDFRSDEERGQMTMFTEECSGMCGV